MVAVGGLGLSEGLNSGVPLLDEGAHLVSGDVEAIEVGVALEALDFLALQAHLSPALLVSVLVQVTERDLENATAERIGRDFYSTRELAIAKSNAPSLHNRYQWCSSARADLLTLSGCFIARGQSRGRVVEVGRHFHVVPLLLDERMGATNNQAS